MTSRFTISGRLPGMNEIVGLNRINRFAGASQKKKETKRVCWAIMAGGVSKFTAPVSIHFDWYEPNLKRDVGNIRAGEKFVSDALVEMGKIKNDTQEWVTGMSDSFLVDRKNPRVEVTISD